MIGIYFDIFKRCFDFFGFGIRDFEEISEISECRNFDCTEDGKTVGFASVQGNNIRLICVLPEYRGKGFGTRLLLQAEEHIHTLGHDYVNIGGGDSGIFIGATVESAGFFERHGYKFGDVIAEMCGSAGEIKGADLSEPDDIRFGYFDGSREVLKIAVAKVDEDWVKYFDDGDVFCAFRGNEIASFCLTDDDETCILSDSVNRIGSVGCVGTVPEFRKRGIGLNMVALASDELKKRGCGKIFIHYTHIYDWYAKLGYKTFLWVRLGGKPLPR